MKTKTLSQESVGFRVPSRLMRALQARADQEGRSVSDVIRRILVDQLNVQPDELSVRLRNGRGGAA